MKQNHLSKTILFTALLVMFFMVITLPVSSIQDKKKEDKTRVASPTTTNTTNRAGTSLFDPGVDLVVSRVKLKRGIFAGSHKIQIIVYVKNMCNGRTGKRIKVWMPHVMAIWIEGGIGPKQEKRSAAYYIESSSTPGNFSFDVHIDNNNTIKENNESNNTATGVRIRADQTEVTYRHTPIGPHCPENPKFQKYRMKERAGRR